MHLLLHFKQGSTLIISQTGAALMPVFTVAPLLVKIISGRD